MKNNKIYFNGKLAKLEDLPNNITLIITGDNNTIKLNDFKGRGKLFIKMDCDNSVFDFGTDNTINKSVLVYYPTPEGKKLKNVSIEIGNNNIFNGDNIVFLSPIEENNKISFGSFNLLAGNIYIRGRNDHIIFNKKNHEILNKEKNVIIGDKIWICDNVQILPKTIIKDESVIALGSIVNKSFKFGNVLIAGVPALIKKKNISWHISNDINKIDYEFPLKIQEEGEINNG